MSFWGFAMTFGLAPQQGDLLRSPSATTKGRVAVDWIHGVLHREYFALFPADGQTFPAGVRMGGPSTEPANAVTWAD